MSIASAVGGAVFGGGGGGGGGGILGALGKGLGWILSLFGSPGMGQLMNIFQSIQSSSDNEEVRKLALELSQLGQDELSDLYDRVMVTGLPDPAGPATYRGYYGSGPQAGERIRIPSTGESIPEMYQGLKEDAAFYYSAEESNKRWEATQEIRDDAGNVVDTAGLDSEKIKTMAADLEADAKTRYTEGVADFAKGQEALEERRDLGLLEGQQYVAGLEKRLTTGMDMLAGQGDQARLDLLQQWENAAGLAQTQVAASGLGSTSIGLGVGRSYTQGQTDALARQDEALRAQQFNAYTGLSGDVAAGRAANIATNIGLRGDVATGLFEGAAFGANLYGDVLNAGYGRLDTLQGQQAYMAGLGQWETEIGAGLTLGQIVYSDQNFGAGLAAEEAYAVAPVTYDIGLTQAEVANINQTQYLPAPTPQPIDTR